MTASGSGRKGAQSGRPVPLFDGMQCLWSSGTSSSLEDVERAPGLQLKRPKVEHQRKPFLRRSRTRENKK